ncbi:Transcriptional regulator PadR-like family protein [Methylobacterium sp. UNC300MFChir4.1]|uniref:helix-turn-helix transcriptional regulator n=1 Tax=Methylobacterium sp. UNC300MFChir4.1 TaxID=1502747 RepID=UPI0008D1AD34|nr:helix-turn-helix transcriptional regulator [Methylobacterium sp. UNC300MFChir4.1]SEP09399.1 Transcriptional regulator PadR-like family protein [Methylobacterium sp. UNC300MFChir4.1]
MYKLPPGSLYRLRTLAQTGARFYQVSGYMRRMEVLGLIEATGRTDPGSKTVEYRITDAGRAELEERHGLS